MGTRIENVFLKEQAEGLLLALKGRLVIVAIIALWIAATRPAPLVYHTLAAVAVFGLLGLCQFILIRRHSERLWITYGFAVIDAGLLTVAIVVFSASTIADLPPPLVYRFHSFLYFFLFLAAAAFSYSPALVLWTGLAGSLAWGAGVAWVMWTQETVSYGDIPPTRDPEDFLAVFFAPNFIGLNSRIAEVIVLAAVAALLALAVWRARDVVYRHAIAEEERERVAEAFGKYVPEAVARAIIADRGVLAPEQRVATVLFVDVERFTALAEAMRPAEVVAVLNDYFDAVAEIIGRNGGVINQFQGDAILATFNLPVAVSSHASAAVRTAMEIQRVVGERVFAGVGLRVRIGINTGEMVAGNVGASGRLNYTVHGDAVNLAARLEKLNKEHGTRILVSEQTARGAGPRYPFTPVGKVALRGRSGPVTIYALPG